MFVIQICLSNMIIALLKQKSSPKWWIIWGLEKQTHTAKTSQHKRDYKLRSLHPVMMPSHTEQITSINRHLPTAEQNPQLLSWHEEGTHPEELGWHPYSWSSLSLPAACSYFWFYVIKSSSHPSADQRGLPKPLFFPVTHSLTTVFNTSYPFQPPISFN